MKAQLRSIEGAEDILQNNGDSEKKMIYKEFIKQKKEINWVEQATKT